MEQIDKTFERKLFFHYARNYLEEMRLLFRGGRLSPKEGDWNNVIDHCLVQGAASEVMASQLKLEAGEAEILKKTAFSHDWRKRLDKKPEEFTEEQKQKTEKFLKIAAPDPELMQATEAGFTKKCAEGETTFLQDLQFYIDDCVKGSEMVEYEERIREVEARNPMSDPKWAKELGGPFWDIERLALRRVEQAIFFRLKREGADIDLPQKIPVFVRQKIEEEIKLKRMEREKEKSDFKLDILAEKQAESGVRQNEDAFALMENKDVLVAAVMDGATALSSITGTKNAKESSGVFAAQFAAVGVEKEYDKAESAKDLLLAGNRKISDVLISQGVDPEKIKTLELSNCQATLVRIDKIKKKIEFAQTGDTVCLIKRRDGRTELVIPPEITPQDQEGLLLAQKISQEKGIGIKQALGDPAVNEIMVKGREICNKSDGTGVGVLNGQSSAGQYIKIKSYPFDEVARIVLLSDGLFLPVKLGEAAPDWNKMMDIIEREGIKGLYQKILEENKNDPAFEKYPRYKQYDDATGIVIDLDK